MDKLQDILNDLFFSVHNRNFLIPVLLCFIIISVQLYRFSVMDLKYRTLKNHWQIFSLYPLALFVGYAMYGLSTDFFFGFFSVLIYFYIVELYNYIMARGRGIGDDKYLPFISGADILCAPLYTVWFGSGVIIYTIIFLLVLIVASSQKAQALMNSLLVDKSMAMKNRIALLPCMFMSYLICLLLYFLV